MSMWIPVISALVTGALAIVGNLLISRSQNDKLTTDLYNKLDKQSELSDQKIQGRIDVIETKIETLSNRVDHHNNIIDRTYGLERSVSVLETKVNVLEAKQ